MNFDLILANFAKHINLDESEKNYALSVFAHKVVKKKSVLSGAGDICKSMTFVLKGCLRIFHMDRDGKEHVLLFAPEDWWAVDLFSFTAHTPAYYTIDALEDTEVLQITFDKLEILYQKVPKFERFFRILVQNGFVMHQRRIATELTLTADQKYEKLKKQYPNLEQRIAQKHIASYLGITPVFLSMMRKKR